MPDRTVPAASALAVADHELAARLARGWVLQHRPLRTRRDVANLVDELGLWHRNTREAMVRRAGGHEVAARFERETGLLTQPDDALPVAHQAASVRAQLDVRLAWLDELRGELAGYGHDLPTGPAEAAWGPLVVLRSKDSSTADAAINALRALGKDVVHEVVVTDLADLDAVMDAHAALVVVDRLLRTDRPTTASALALGWAVGALGRERVLAVLGRGVQVGSLGGACAAVAVEGHRRWRTEAVAWAAAATRP